MADASNSNAVEIWKPVIGWEDRYEVSSLGRIKSLPFELHLKTRWGNYTTRHTRERIMRPNVNPSGYHMVSFKRDGRRTAYYIHRLVCEAFHGTADGLEVAHIDGTRDNNAASNLRWATKAENEADKMRHGTIPRGEKHSNAVLTVDAVREIRSQEDHTRDGDLAEAFGVKMETVRAVRLGYTWKWVR